MSWHSIAEAVFSPLCGGEGVLVGGRGGKKGVKEGRGRGLMGGEEGRGAYFARSWKAWGRGTGWISFWVCVYLEGGFMG